MSRVSLPRCRPPLSSSPLTPAARRRHRRSSPFCPPSLPLRTARWALQARPLRALRALQALQARPCNELWLHMPPFKDKFRKQEHERGASAYGLGREARSLADPRFVSCVRGRGRGRKPRVARALISEGAGRNADPAPGPFQFRSCGCSAVRTPAEGRADRADGRDGRESCRRRGGEPRPQLHIFPPPPPPRGPCERAPLPCTLPWALCSDSWRAATHAPRRWATVASLLCARCSPCTARSAAAGS